MNIKVNCIYNDKGAWCSNPSVKRSLFGLGARVCSEYGKVSCRNCIYSEPNPRPDMKTNKGEMHGSTS